MITALYKCFTYLLTYLLNTRLWRNSPKSIKLS